MSKELTPLEALEEIKKFKEDCYLFGSSDIEIDKAIDEIETALKALEIIKEKWGDSILSDIENGFVLGSPYVELPSKEKSDLLKEVLL